MKNEFESVTNEIERNTGVYKKAGQPTNVNRPGGCYSARELFKIPHPDFESDERFSYFLLVDTKGKKAFDKGKEIPITSIFKESVEMNIRQ